jgi:hypothetical protein
MAPHGRGRLKKAPCSHRATARKAAPAATAPGPVSRPLGVPGPDSTGCAPRLGGRVTGSAAARRRDAPQLPPQRRKRVAPAGAPPLPAPRPGRGGRAPPSRPATAGTGFTMRRVALHGEGPQRPRDAHRQASAARRPRRRAGAGARPCNFKLGALSRVGTRQAEVVYMHLCGGPGPRGRHAGGAAAPTSIEEQGAGVPGDGGDAPAPAHRRPRAGRQQAAATGRGAAPLSPWGCRRRRRGGA